LIHNIYPGEGKWEFRFSKTANEKVAEWVLQVHDKATATTSLSFLLVFDSNDDADSWIAHNFELIQYDNIFRPNIRGEVASSVAGPIIHEIFNLATQDQGIYTPWFYGQYYGQNPRAVRVVGSSELSLA
jgi:hypothetical protein